MNKNSGFTLIEMITSLFLLSILIILLSSSIRLTSVVSSEFLDYTDYEYALMHKKITEMYEDAEKVYKKGNKIYLENNKSDTSHVISVTNNKVYKSTRNKGESSFKGYSLLLENVNSSNLEVEKRNDDEIITLYVIDRGNKARLLKLKSKDEQDKENIDDED